jgi:four helix bundle protein
MGVRSAKELTVYKKAYALAMGIFEISKRFPREEQYALTGQIRRSSRSVSMCLREAWAKRRYRAHFLSKLTDCDGENGETDTSLVFAKDLRLHHRCGASGTNRSVCGSRQDARLDDREPRSFPDSRILTPDP